MRLPQNMVRATWQTQRRRYSPSSAAPFSRSFSSNSPWPTFGIAFDIDGVILRGSDPIGGSVAALRRLYHDSFSNVKVPYVFLTNGGGVPESKRASELSKLLGVNILSSQVLQGHTPFKQLLKKFENELVVAVGKGEPATVMSEYGYKNVISIDEYATCFDNIDPIASYKKWTIKQDSNQSSISKGNVCSQRVQATFVVSDPVDWSRDIQVLCDILRTGGLPGKEIAHQPPLFFANDDLEYQGVFPTERLGMGAFRIALESIFNSIHPNPLEYTSFGKPNPSVFKNAEIALRELLSSCHDQTMNHVMKQNHAFKTLYMVGDNPSVDIKGARQAGLPWVSILTRTGVFKGEGNHTEHSADMGTHLMDEDHSRIQIDFRKGEPYEFHSGCGSQSNPLQLVFDTVEEAVDYVLVKEGMKN